MKRFLILPLLVALGAALAAWNTAEQRAADTEAVRQAVLDYVEGIYEVEPERISRSVHPSLHKIGYYRPRDASDYGEEVLTMTFEELVSLAETWNKEGRLPADAPKEVVVFDVQDKTAAAKLTAQWGTDYFHLANIDGAWKILNVLWQSPMPEQATANE